MVVLQVYVWIYDPVPLRSKLIGLLMGKLSLLVGFMLTHILLLLQHSIVLLPVSNNHQRQSSAISASPWQLSVDIQGCPFLDFIFTHFLLPSPFPSVSVRHTLALVTYSILDAAHHAVFVKVNDYVLHRLHN